MNISFDQLPGAVSEINNRLNNIERLLKEQASAARPDQDTTPDIGGMALALQITGLKKPTIYAKVQRGELPHFKKAGRLYFSRQALTRWIEEGAVKTAQDIDKAADQYINSKRK